MDRYPKQLYSLTDIQITTLAQQRTHDKQTQQAFEKLMSIASQGGTPRAFFCGFGEFTILDENAAADWELLKGLEKTAKHYKG